MCVCEIDFLTPRKMATLRTKTKKARGLTGVPPPRLAFRDWPSERFHKKASDLTGVPPPNIVKNDASGL